MPLRRYLNATSRGNLEAYKYTHRRSAALALRDALTFAQVSGERTIPVSAALIFARLSTDCGPRILPRDQFAALIRDRASGERRFPVRAAADFAIACGDFRLPRLPILILAFHSGVIARPTSAALIFPRLSGE